MNKSAKDQANDKPKGNGADIECRDIPWECCRCNALLGYVDAATRTTLRVKYKDSYLWIGEASWVRVICRSCAAMNELLNETKISDEKVVREDSFATIPSGATEESAPELTVQGKEKTVITL